MSVSCPLDATRAREFFPRGLYQPEDGFRFSMDALLLACFAVPKSHEVVVDLGTGCGIVGLAFLLRYGEKGLRVIGVDAEKEMVDAARENVRRLCYEDQMTIIHGDVCCPGKVMKAESANVVVSNPPYRKTGRGQSCLHEGKNRARFEVGASLDDFMRGAGFVLKNRGRCYIVYLAEHLDLLFASMKAARIVPKRVLPVQARLGEAARLVLVEGRKNGGQGLVMESPLCIYCSGDLRTRLTEDILDFCPFLACNAGAL